jgi:hypothetical protein
MPQVWEMAGKGQGVTPPRRAAVQGCYKPSFVPSMSHPNGR